jgi:xanthine dehydrogenase accessory factor
MQTQEQDVLSHLLAWCNADQPGWLCTIVSTTGSSPRPVGAMLACTADGRQAGSVSGGCVEEDLLEKLRAGEFAGPGPHRVRYGVTAEENERLGLPCGGHLHLLVQEIQRSDSQWLQAILDAVAERRCVLRRVDLQTGATTVEAVDRHSALEIDDTTLRQAFGPTMRMLLVGAGQLARNLAELALAMDYEVLVTDTRAEVLSQWEGPAVPLLQGMPDDVVREQAADPYSVVITLTHDPRIDDMALMEALTTDAWYVGALGSRKTTEKRLARLRQLDLQETQLARLHAPVGLPIGSKTPIEIAIAIMAELTQLRRGA